MKRLPGRTRTLTGSLLRTALTALAGASLAVGWITEDQALGVLGGIALGLLVVYVTLIEDTRLATVYRWGYYDGCNGASTTYQESLELQLDSIERELERIQAKTRDMRERVHGRNPDRKDQANE